MIEDIPESTVVMSGERVTLKTSLIFTFFAGELLLIIMRQGGGSEATEAVFCTSATGYYVSLYSLVCKKSA